jgi:hypothetical protein
LVWTEYRLIKETSALTFMIAGTCKEIVTGEEMHMRRSIRCGCGPVCLLRHFPFDSC